MQLVAPLHPSPAPLASSTLRRTSTVGLPFLGPSSLRGMKMRYARERRKKVDRRGEEGRRERRGGCLEEGFAKISRPPAAAAFRNEERREREVVADDDGDGGRGRTGGRAADRGAREGAKRERSQKWRKKRNGECTQHRRVRKRAFREYRSSPLDGLTERRRRGSRGGRRLWWGTARGTEKKRESERGWKRGQVGKEDEWS